MKPTSLTIFLSVSICDAFIHPLLNLRQGVMPNRIPGRTGFPTTSFWSHKPKSQLMTERGVKLDDLDNNAICSYPCQRKSHFIKLEDVLRKKGLDYELRLVFNLIFLDMPFHRLISLGISEI